MLHAQVQSRPAALAHSEDAHRDAYNAAFRELGLGWRWDSDTYRDLLRIPEERNRICAYVQSQHAHMLKAYEIGFLSDLVYETKERCYAQLLERTELPRW